MATIDRKRGFFSSCGYTDYGSDLDYFANCVFTIVSNYVVFAKLTLILASNQIAVVTVLVLCAAQFYKHITMVC